MNKVCRHWDPFLGLIILFVVLIEVVHPLSLIFTRYHCSPQSLQHRQILQVVSSSIFHMPQNRLVSKLTLAITCLPVFHVFSADSLLQFFNSTTFQMPLLFMVQPSCPCRKSAKTMVVFDIRLKMKVIMFLLPD